MFTLFQTCITCGKTILEYRHWFCYIFFLFDFINKNSVFNRHVLCFSLVPKLELDFHWYRYRIQKCWYRDNISADYIGYDSNVYWIYTSVSKYLYYVLPALSVITDYLILIFMHFLPKSQQAVEHTQLFSNHSSGRLLQSLQSYNHIQSENRASWWGESKIGQKIAFYFEIMIFNVKILITL